MQFGKHIDSIWSMTKLITIPLSEHKQLLAKVSNLESKLEQLTLQYQALLSQHQGLTRQYNELNVKYNKLLADNDGFVE